METGGPSSSFASSPATTTCPPSSSFAFFFFSISRFLIRFSRAPTCPASSIPLPSFVDCNASVSFRQSYLTTTEEEDVDMRRLAASSSLFQNSSHWRWKSAAADPPPSPLSLSSSSSSSRGRVIAMSDEPHFLPKFQLSLPVYPPVWSWSSIDT